MSKQRLRIVFAKGSYLKFISHLDLTLAWERVLRRAGVPLAYSQGYNPQARLQLASGLPLGYSSSGEVMDIILNEAMAPEEFIEQLRPALPEGLNVKSVTEVPAKSPSLQSALRQAIYRVTIETSLPAPELSRRISNLLAADHLEQQRIRKSRQETFNIRPLVKDVSLERINEGEEQAVLLMRLGAGQKGNVRPDSVLAALGLAHAHALVERMQLLFEFDND